MGRSFVKRGGNAAAGCLAPLCWCLLGLAALPWQAASAQGVVLDKIVAVVNNDVIMRSEFERRRSLMISQIQSEGGLPPSELLLQKQVLDVMIANKLQLQLAAISEIDVAEEEVDSMVSDIARRNGVDLQTFRSVLEKDGFRFSVFREEIRDEMIVRNLRRSQVESRVSVSDQEVEYYLATLRRQGATGLEYRMAHILIGSDGEEQDGVADPELMVRASVVKERLDQGEDFAAVAANFSDAADAADGGDLGWRKLNEIPSVFVNHLPEMGIGDVVGPVSSSSGLHFATILETRSVDQVIVPEHRVRHILVRITENRDEQVALERVNIARDRILQQGEDFAAVAADMSDDISNAVDGGLIGWVREGERGPEFDQQLLQAEVNVLSEPFRSRAGWHIMQVLERRQHDDTDFSIREKARESIYRRKLDSAYRSWLGDIRSEAYIEIRMGEQGSQG